MKKRFLFFTLIFIFLFSVTVFAENLSPQAKQVLEKFQNFFKNRGINVKVLLDKPIPDKNIKLPGYRFVTIKIWKGKRSQTLSFFTDGNYIIRDFEIAGRPMNLIENFQSEYLVYKVPVSNDEIVFGSPNAKVKVVLFGDFECPFCKRTLLFLLEKYKNNKDVVLYFKHYPLPFHRYAKLFSRIYEAGKHVNVNLAEFIEKLNYKRGEKEEELKKQILEKVKNLIPSEKWDDFVKYIDNKEIMKKIEKNMTQGNELGVRATPTVFINGKKVVGAKLNLIQKLIEENLKK